MASAAVAVEANLFAFFQHLAGWPRVEFHEDQECCWVLSDIPFPLFNSVMRTRLSLDRIDALIDARVAACLSRRVPMLWWTGPSTTPVDLGARLERHGFVLEAAYGMAADLHRALERDVPLPDETMSVGPVEDAVSLANWSRVLCDSFSVPRAFGDAFAELATTIGLGAHSPFRHFLGSANGEPAATCSLYLGAGVAGIYDVATLPALRKRGLGRLVTLAAMQEARARGYRMAILHSSALGAGMYRGLGFADVCPIGQHVWVPPGFTR